MEPTVSEEKLRLLLAEGHESEQLDYKAACDLALARDTVELAKDVGAMQVLGGYLVIGADDHGKTTGILTAEQANQFDESRLRAKVRKYLAEPLDLLSAVHTIEGVLVAVIYVGPNSNGMAIFASDGAYGDQKMAFREGDVFVRHGTASERWQQADLDRIYERAISVRKEGWRREIAESLREALEAGRGTQDLAAGPVEAVDWRLDADTFVGIIMEQLRRGDDIPLHLALEHMTTDAIAFESVDGHEELSTLLDRLACLGALFVRIERPDCSIVSCTISSRSMRRRC